LGDHLRRRALNCYPQPKEYSPTEMRFIYTPALLSGFRSAPLWPSYALLALLACPYIAPSARPVRAAVPSMDTLIQVLFGDLPDTDGVDANGDGALTIADVLPLPRVLFAGPVAEVAPHHVGDQLVYRVTDPMGLVTTETFTVTSSDAQGTFVVDDQVVDSQQHVVLHVSQSYTDAGTMLFSGNSADLLRNVRTVCNPPLLRLTTPIRAGQKSSTTVLCEIRWITPDVVLGTLKRTDAYTPLDIVDNLSIPAGTYSGVLHITGTTDLSGEHEADEIYIVPGVGTIVQLATFRRKTTRHELVSGTVGGLPVTR
jgi:hypothetical protein